MEQKGIFKLKNLKIITISLTVLAFLIAIASPFMVKYGYFSLAKSLLAFLYDILIPVTGFFMILTFIYNFKLANTEKRTEKQELIVKQKFWGRISLLTLSGIISFLYSLVNPLGYWIAIMFLLFVLSILAGPLFGRIIIKE